GKVELVKVPEVYGEGGRRGILHSHKRQVLTPVDDEVLLARPEQIVAVGKLGVEGKFGAVGRRSYEIDQPVEGLKGDLAIERLEAKAPETTRESQTSLLQLLDACLELVPVNRNSLFSRVNDSHGGSAFFEWKQRNPQRIRLPKLLVPRSSQKSWFLA